MYRNFLKTCNCCLLVHNGVFNWVAEIFICHVHQFDLIREGGGVERGGAYLLSSKEPAGKFRV